MPLFLQTFSAEQGLSSHSVPENPGKQTQVKFSPSGKHRPPFRQGENEHESYSQLLPEKPMGHSQEKSPPITFVRFENNRN